MMFCQNCGVPLESGAPGCPRCGKAADRAQYTGSGEPMSPAAHQQPYPITPYDAWQQPPYPAYAAYPRQPKAPVTSTFAILGFVMAWLPIPLAWLVLSIIGLVQCGQAGQKGRGLAIAAILLRVLGVAALIAGGALLIHYANTGGYYPDFWDWEEGFSFMLTR
jgi:hypothetical protein